MKSAFYPLICHLFQIVWKLKVEIRWCTLTQCNPDTISSILTSQEQRPAKMLSLTTTQALKRSKCRQRVQLQILQGRLTHAHLQNPLVQAQSCHHDSYFLYFLTAETVKGVWLEHHYSWGFFFFMAYFFSHFSIPRCVPDWQKKQQKTNSMFVFASLSELVLSQVLWKSFPFKFSMPTKVILLFCCNAQVFPWPVPQEIRERIWKFHKSKIFGA